MGKHLKGNRKKYKKRIKKRIKENLYKHEESKKLDDDTSSQETVIPTSDSSNETGNNKDDVPYESGILYTSMVRYMKYKQNYLLFKNSFNKTNDECMSSPYDYST